MPIAQEPIGPRLPGDASPLSFNEERLWCLDRFQPDGPSNNLQVAVRIHSQLNPEDLRRAVNEVVQRHEALRTTYVEQSGVPVRIVEEQPEFDILWKDFSSLDEVARATRVEEVLEREGARRFDPALAPLVRVLVLELAEADFAISVTMHPIISDGPSLRIFIRETLTCYQAIQQGQPFAPAQLPYQYADFAAWQMSHKRTLDFEKHLDYWKEKLGDSGGELHLQSVRRSNRPQKSTQLYEGATCDLTISASRLLALKELCLRQDTTLFMVLLAAFEELLYRNSGQANFLVGVLASHRGRVGTDSLIGSFGNRLPLLADVSGDPSFIELLDRVRQVSLEAFAHSDLPYDRLLDEICLPRLRAVLLVPEAIAGGELGDLRLTPLPIRSRSAAYDLQLSCIEMGEQLVVSLRYRTSVFDKVDADEIISCFDSLLTAAVQEPERPLRSLGQASECSQEPGRVIVGDEIAAAPRPTDAGKERVSSPASDALETQLVSLWESTLTVSPIGIDDNFFELGGHSLPAVRLFALIEKVLGQRLPLNSLLEAPTIRQLAELLRRDGWSQRWAALVPIQPAGRNPPFYCVHGAGGNVLFLRELARRVGRDQPFYAFQAIGLDGVTPPLRSVEEMATHYIGELKTVQPHGPYYLGGYCFGSNVAFEMARQLEESGETVAFLGIFNEAGAWRTLGSAREGAAMHIATLRRLEWQQRLSYVRERVMFRAIQMVSAMVAIAVWGTKRIYGETGHALPSGLAQFHVEKLTREAGARYQPQRYRGSLTLFHAQTLALPAEGTFWDNVVDGTVEKLELPGDDASMFTEPIVDVLAERLSSCLRRARMGTGTPTSSDDSRQSESGWATGTLPTSESRDHYASDRLGRALRSSDDLSPRSNRG